MADLKSVLSRSPSVVTRKTGKEYVLVPVTNNIADMTSVYTLNETGAFIWEQIDGSINTGQIIELLVTEYNIDYDTAAIDVFNFIRDLENYLITSHD